MLMQLMSKEKSEHKASRTIIHDHLKSTLKAAATNSIEGHKIPSFKVFSHHSPCICRATHASLFRFGGAAVPLRCLPVCSEVNFKTDSERHDHTPNST